MIRNNIPQLVPYALLTGSYYAAPARYGLVHIMQCNSLCHVVHDGSLLVHTHEDKCALYMLNASHVGNGGFTQIHFQALVYFQSRSSNGKENDGTPAEVPTSGALLFRNIQ